MRHRALVVVTIVAAALIASHVASGVESTILPGVGIGKVKIGLSLSQVKKVLGKDLVINQHETYRGVGYVEYGWDFSSWTVTFRNRDGVMRAVQVSYSLRGQRTPNRIGVGSTLQQVARVYPHAVCGYYALLVVTPNGVQTVFKFDGRNPHPTGKPAPLDHEYWVSQVVVRQPFQPQREFAKRCRDDWLKQNNPTP